MRGTRLLPVSLLLLTLPAPARAAPGSLYDDQFRGFYEPNRGRATPRGSLEQVYEQVRRDHLAGQLRPKAGALLESALGVGACGLAQVQKLRSALKLAGGGIWAKAIGDAACDGTRKASARRQSLGEHVSNLAGLAGWMIPGVSACMPALAGAQLAKSACEGVSDLREGMTLARGELLAVARQAGIAPPAELYDGYRAELEALRASHAAELERALGQIREHRPLLARARRGCRAQTDLIARASAFASRTWYEEILHRALASARAEKRELAIVRGVLATMDAVR